MKVTDKINKVHHLNFLENDLPDKCANLIIADPPYYKVKGAFDFIWKTFEDYLKDVEKWAIECKRLLADNGTLYLYGDAKNIAYSQIIFDKHFNLLNSLVWENINDHKQQIRFNTDLRTFAPLTERLLMYSNEINYSTELQEIQNNQKLYKPIRDYLHNERLKINESLSTINKNAFGDKSGKDGMAGNILSPYKKGWSFPTMDKYNKLQKSYNICLKPYEQLLKEYEDLRKEYEDLRRPFNNERFYGDVIRIPNFETTNYAHDTIKPEKLTRELILVSSRKNDLVIVPFAGSGTECAMSAKENRNFIGYEIEEKYVKIANERIINHTNQQKLF